jgi:hypothetical protein
MRTRTPINLKISGSQRNPLVRLALFDRHQTANKVHRVQYKNSAETVMCARNFHPISIDIIQQEHQHLSAVIQTMLEFVRSTDKGDAPPDLKLFRAILFTSANILKKYIILKKTNFCFPRLKSVHTSSTMCWMR